MNTITKQAYVEIPKPLNDRINAYSKNILKGRHKGVFLAELLKIAMDSIENQTFNFEQYLIHNIDGVNQDNVKDIIETLIDNQAFKDMLKVSVETVLQKDSDVHPMTMQEQSENLSRVAKLLNSYLPSTQDFLNGVSHPKKSFSK